MKLTEMWGFLVQYTKTEGDKLLDTTLENVFHVEQKL